MCWVTVLTLVNRVRLTLTILCTVDEISSLVAKLCPRNNKFAQILTFYLLSVTLTVELGYGSRLQNSVSLKEHSIKHLIHSLSTELNSGSYILAFLILYTLGVTLTLRFLDKTPCHNKWTLVWRYVKFQSSIMNGYWEKDNWNKKLYENAKWKGT